MWFDWVSPFARNMLPTIGNVGLNMLNLPTTPNPGTLGMGAATNTNIDGISVACTSTADPRTCRARSVAGEVIKKQVDNRGTQKVVNNVVPSQLTALYSAGTVGKITNIISSRDARVTPQPLKTPSFSSLLSSRMRW